MTIVGYKVFNRKLQIYLPKIYKTLRSAKRAVDRVDNEYGAYIAHHVAIEKLTISNTEGNRP